MRRLVRCGYLRGFWRDIWETHEIGSEVSDNIVYRVKDSGVENCETPSGMNRGRLGTGSPHDDEKGSIPLDNGIEGLICIWGRLLMPCRRASQDLGSKTRAH